MRYLNFIEIDDNVGLQLASAALLGLALLPILVGSFSSLQLMATTSDTPRRRSSRHHQEEETTEEKAIVITTKDAFLFPLIGSALLYSLYLLLTEVSTGAVNQIIQVGVALLSCAVFANTLSLVLKYRLPSEYLGWFDKYKLSISKKDSKVYQTHFTVIHLVTMVTSWILAIFYASTESWIVGNMFSIALAVDCIGSLTVDSFLTGFLLLFGMLIYDVFWLFGADIISFTAGALSYAPTTIVWPRNINTYIFERLLKSNQYFTSVGLGDIIVPGIFIAYCLRFDKSNALKEGRDEDAVRFHKPYFVNAVIAYAVAAGTSIYLAHFTEQSHSALLFIVPALIISTIVTAVKRKETSRISGCREVVKTINKLSTLSDDNDQEDDESEEEEERPARFAARKTTSRAASKSTTASRSTSVARSRGRPRSTSRTSKRSKSKPKTMVQEASDAVAHAASGVADEIKSVTSSKTGKKRGPYKKRNKSVSKD